MLIVRWRRDERILHVVVEPAVFAALTADPTHEALTWLRWQVAPRTARLVRIRNRQNLDQMLDLPLRPQPELYPGEQPFPQYGGQDPP